MAQIDKLCRTGNIFSDTYRIKYNGRFNEVDIKQLWEFISFGFGCFPLNDEILVDLNKYELIQEMRGEIWSKGMNKKRNLRKTTKLQENIGTYSL